MRLHSVTGTIENGFVHLPDKASWLGDYLHEMTSFPKGKFDDQCDSTAQALDWVNRGYGSDGFMKYLERATRKHEAESAKDKADECPACRSQSFSTTGPQKRCNDCGNQWGRGRPYQHPTKAQLLGRRRKR